MKIPRKGSPSCALKMLTEKIDYLGIPFLRDLPEKRPRVRNSKQERTSYVRRAGVLLSWGKMLLNSPDGHLCNFIARFCGNK